MNTTIPFNQLKDGNFTQAVSTLLFDSMSFWWVFLLFIITLFMVYIVTKEEAAVAFVGMAGSAFLLYMIPEGMPVIAHAIFYLIIVLSIAMLLWRFLGKGE